MYRPIIIPVSVTASRYDFQGNKIRDLTGTERQINPDTIQTVEYTSDEVGDHFILDMGGDTIPIDIPVDSMGEKDIRQFIAAFGIRPSTGTP